MAASHHRHRSNEASQRRREAEAGMESSTPYKGGEIDSRQAEAIDTLSSANEYQGQSRIQTLRKLPWNRKWKYFRDQLLARTVVIAAIVCVVVYIAVQILAPAPGP